MIPMQLLKTQMFLGLYAKLETNSFIVTEPVVIKALRFNTPLYRSINYYQWVAARNVAFSRYINTDFICYYKHSHYF